MCTQLTMAMKLCTTCPLLTQVLQQKHGAISIGIHFLCQVVEIRVKLDCVCVLQWCAWLHLYQKHSKKHSKTLIARSMHVVFWTLCSSMTNNELWYTTHVHHAHNTVCLLLQELLFLHACMPCHTCGSDCDMIQHQSIHSCTVSNPHQHATTSLPVARQQRWCPYTWLACKFCD